MTIDVTEHMRMARFQALSWSRGRQWLREDMIAQAYLALVEATRTFDADRGVKFGSYAQFCVRSHLANYALENGHDLRLGKNPTTSQAVRWARGREGVTAEDFMTEFGMAKSRAEALARVVGMRSVPIDHTTKGQNDTPWQDLIPGEWRMPDDLVDERMGADRIDSMLAGLSPREREAVVMHILEEKTFPEIAEKWGCSRQATHAYLERAKGRLRKMLKEAV